MRKRKLKKFRVDEISLATSPANRRSFLMLKDLKDQGQEILKALHHHLEAINEIIRGDEATRKILSAAASVTADDEELGLDPVFQVQRLAEVLRSLHDIRLYVDLLLKKESHYPMGDDFEKEEWRVGGDRDLTLVDDESWDADAAVASVRSWASDENGEIDFMKYRKAFIIYDADAPENLTSYKFPFARVVDGQLRASRSGLIAAKGAAAGARTGRRHPLADRIISFVNGYLNEEEKEMARMSEESKEMEAKEHVNDTNALTKEELQVLLKEIETLKARAESAERAAKAEREARLQKEYEAKAEAYAALGIEKDACVKIMRTLDEAGVEWEPHFKKIAQRLSETGVFKEYGTSVVPIGPSLFEKVRQELSKDKDADPIEVVRRILRDNPTEYDEYRKQFKAT